jgi:hypothetical protein
MSGNSFKVKKLISDSIEATLLSVDSFTNPSNARDALGVNSSEITSFDTDALKLESDVKEGVTVRIEAEGGRIEEFTGAASDPNHFFVAGFTPVEIPDDGEGFYSVDLNGYYALQYGSWYNQEFGSSYIDGVRGNWSWYLASGDDPILYTSTDEVDYPSQINNWVANPSYPTLPSTVTISPDDNSAACVGYTYMFVPVGVSSGRYRYIDYDTMYYGSDNSVEFKDGSEGVGWYYELESVVLYSNQTTAYPWQAGNWATVGNPHAPRIHQFTRSPQGNQANWAVKRNIVPLIVENYTGRDLTIEGKTIPTDTMDFVAWVNPEDFSLLWGDLDEETSYGENITFSSLYPFYNTSSESGGVTAGISVSPIATRFSIPFVVPARIPCWIYFSA